ncbi:MAG: hypothetical protein ACFFCW_17645 [Candidatus Hodarchaeota archaeon]
METKRFSFSIVLSLLIAVVGIIAPMAWEKYRTKSSLELQHLSTTTLLEKSPAIAKLKIFYDNKEIDSLSKIRFALVNNGRKPIMEKDLISPPTIIFSKGANLLELKTERLIPENIEFRPELNSSARSAILSFPLLNPSDVIEFSILLAGRLPNYKAEARIAGIAKLKIIDRAKELGKQPKRISWTVYPVGFFTLFCILLIVRFGIPESIKETKTMKRYLSPGAELPKYQKKSDYLKFIQQELSYIKTKDKLKLTRLVEEQEADILNAESQKLINDQIIEIISGPGGSKTATVMLLMLTCIGLWYVLSNVL